MILTEHVLISSRSKMKEFYKKLGYNISTDFLIKIDDLTKGSKIKVLVKCDYCGSEKTISYKDYNKNISIHNKYSCSLICSYDKKRKTNLDKYGVDNPMKSNIFKESSIRTNLDKYGVEYAAQSDMVKSKMKTTNLDKYGVDNPMKSEYFINKVKKTNLDKYGVTCTLHSEMGKIKTEESILIKFGGHNTTSETFRKKFFDISKNLNYINYLNNGISLFKCDLGKEHNFEIYSDSYHWRKRDGIPLCTVCNPIGDKKSIKEKILYEFIKDNYDGKIIQSYRDGLEIDVYLPELKVGFEFNGLYWHSEKFKDRNYHLDKSNYFKSKEIRIIHIWEDDWIFKQNIIKSQIINIFGKSVNRLYARKCVIKEVGIANAKLFLYDNHIQGFVNSSIKIGLYFDNELVSIMTFDHNEGRKKMEESGYNLNRFCNKLGYSVVGGASKLLSYFIQQYNPSRIVSYADKDWSIGDLYYKLGFNKINESKSDYKYIVNYKRVHKSRYKKSKLNTTLTESEEMKNRNILKIYDCGKIKFEKIIYK